MDAPQCSLNCNFSILAGFYRNLVQNLIRKITKSLSLLQNYSEAGVTFPCYYSQLNPWMVMESYHYDETLNDVLASIAIPNGLFVSALGLLLYWYCPYCRAR